MNSSKFNPEEAANRARVRRLYEEGFSQGRLEIA